MLFYAFQSVLPLWCQYALALHTKTLKSHCSSQWSRKFLHTDISGRTFQYLRQPILTDNRGTGYFQSAIYFMVHGLNTLPDLLFFFYNLVGQTNYRFTCWRQWQPFCERRNNFEPQSFSIDCKRWDKAGWETNNRSAAFLIFISWASTDNKWNSENDIHTNLLIINSYHDDLIYLNFIINKVRL